MSEHYPEVEADYGHVLCGDLILCATHPVGEMEAAGVSIRIRATWNACRAIPTEQLAQPVYPAAVVQRLVEALTVSKDLIELEAGGATRWPVVMEKIAAALADVERVGKNTQETQQ